MQASTSLVRPCWGLGSNRSHKAYLLSCLWMSAAIPMHAGKHKFGVEITSVRAGAPARTCNQFGANAPSSPRAEVRAKVTNTRLLTSVAARRTLLLGILLAHRLLLFVVLVRLFVVCEVLSSRHSCTKHQHKREIPRPCNVFGANAPSKQNSPPA